MVTLNDYLYSGDTIFKIIQNYMTDLRKEAKRTHNEIDLVHSNCLLQVQEMLEHNDFLTSQSQKIREFYKYMAKEFPFLAFTFRGRIKSLIRTEEKFNGYIVEYIYNYYEEHGTYPAVADLKEKLSCFRDIIAYRIVIALPKCHLKPGQNLEEEEMKYLYQIANALPGFLEERGFTAEPAKRVRESKSDLLDGEVKPYYRDFISRPCTVISLYISHFMIIRPEAIWKCSFEQRKWTTSRKSDRRITWGMRSVRSMNEQEEMQFQKGNAFTSMRHTSAE